MIKLMTSAFLNSADVEILCRQILLGQSEYFENFELSIELRCLIQWAIWFQALIDETDQIIGVTAR